MNRELNKIFDAKTREARRRILDKFDISNEDKNEVLNKLGNSNENNFEFVPITFTIDEIPYKGIEYMTWKQWINSKCNTINAIIKDDKVAIEMKESDGLYYYYYVEDPDNGYVTNDNEINPNIDYFWSRPLDV